MVKLVNPRSVQSVRQTKAKLKSKQIEPVVSTYRPLFPEALRKRFESKVDKKGPHDCWNWAASTVGKAPHGQIKGPETLAHRMAYRLYKGSIPEGVEVVHSCNNGLCQNPNHLFLNTDLLDIEVKFEGYVGKKRYLTVESAKRIRKRYQVSVDPKTGDKTNNSMELAGEFGLTPKQVVWLAKATEWVKLEEV